MKTFEWKGVNWRVGHPWGNCHPEHKNSWYGEDSVFLHPDNLIYLQIKNNPLEYQGEIHPYSCGLISSINVFSYGTYKITAKLPNTPNSWASLWTCSYNGNWLHEIDICESEADLKGNYNTDLFVGKPFRSFVNTNFHYKDYMQAHHQVGLKGIPKCKFWNKIDIDTYNTYILVFEPTKIEIWVNDTKVRTLKDKRVLEFFNNDPYFYFIFNQDVNNKFTFENYQDRDEMIIRDFKYKIYDTRRS